MDKYFKIINNGYIQSFGVGTNGVEIGAEEYTHIKDAMSSAPDTDAAHSARLRDDLTWEVYDRPAIPPNEPKNTDAEIREKAEAYDILMGGA